MIPLRLAITLFINLTNVIAFFQDGYHKAELFHLFNLRPSFSFLFCDEYKELGSSLQSQRRGGWKATPSRQLHGQIVEVRFPQHLCPFFFITVTVVALLITRHISLHYQLWRWGWWWVLFTAGILWKAQQMSNNYSNGYVEAKKGK